MNVYLAALAGALHRQAVPLVEEELSLLLGHGTFEQYSQVELHSEQVSDVQLLFKVVHYVPFKFPFSRTLEDAKD